MRGRQSTRGILSKSKESSLAISMFGQLGFRQAVDHGWEDLVDQLSRTGIPFWEEGSLRPPTHWLAIDFTGKESLPDFFKSQQLKRALVCVEPKTVNPLQYRPNVQAKFDIIFAPDTSRPIPTSLKLKHKPSSVYNWQRGHLFPWSLPGELDEVRLSAAAIINENKFSLVPGGLYWLRTSLLRQVRKENFSIHVAGANWTRGWWWTIAKQVHAFVLCVRTGTLPDLIHLAPKLGNHKNLKVIGPVKSAVAFLEKYRVAVVIENEATYTSEKLFNALLAGCMCVYVGPDLRHEDFPEGFLLPAKSSVSDIISKIDFALSQHSAITPDQIRSWLSSPASRGWSAQLQNQVLVRAIENWVKGVGH